MEKGLAVYDLVFMAIGLVFMSVWLVSGHSFPVEWLLFWLLPAVSLALRYGTLWGMAGLVPVVTLVLMDGRMTQSLPYWLAGSLILVFLTGESSRQWRLRELDKNRRLKVAERQARQANDAYQILHVSHSYLESQVLDVQIGITGALRQLEACRLCFSGAACLADGLQAVLSSLSGIEQGAFFRVHQGVIEQTPLARVGRFEQETLPADTRLQQATATGEALVAASTGSVLASPDTHWAGIFPFGSNRNDVEFLLIVQRMKAGNLDQQQVNFLRIICDYLGQVMSASQETIKPADEQRLAELIIAAVRIVLNKTASVLMVFIRIRKAVNSDRYINFFVRKIHRSNQVWHIACDDCIGLVMLLPMFNLPDFKSYKQKMHNAFMAEYSLTLKKAGVQMDFQYVSHSDEYERIALCLAEFGRVNHVQVLR